VREQGKIQCFSLGAPIAEVETTLNGVSLVGSHERFDFTPVASPPATIGWQPYELPAEAAEPATRKSITRELLKRFQRRQALRASVIKLIGDRTEAQTADDPAIAAAQRAVMAADADNRIWLLDALRTHGWIGRASHGDKAHEALLGLTVYSSRDLRLAATVLAQLRKEFARNEITEASVAMVADRLAMVMSDPTRYGLEEVTRTDGQICVIVLADLAEVDAGRARIGKPPLADEARQRKALIIRLDADGRQIPDVPGLDGSASQASPGAAAFP
jgi:hypothetical protein